MVTHDVDNELPSAAPPPAGLDDPSDPWALNDPLVSAGMAIPLPDEPSLPPADGLARRARLRRLSAAFPLEERVRATAITITVALVVVTLGWLWLTRPSYDQPPPMHYPQGTAAGDQPGVVLPSGVAPSGNAPSAVPGSSTAQGGLVVPGPSTATSGAPVVDSTPTPAVPPGGTPLTAVYTTKSSTGLLGYKVVVTLTVRNPSEVDHSGWTVVLTVPSGAELQASDLSVDARKDGGTVTITPKDAIKDIAAGTDRVFTVTFGGGALLGIGSGGVTGCTIDGIACAHS